LLEAKAIPLPSQDHGRITSRARPDILEVKSCPIHITTALRCHDSWQSICIERKMKLVVGK